MQRLSLMALVLCGVMSISRYAEAIPTNCLDPNPDRISGLANVFVDINVSGLDSLLGSFDLDFRYDPAVFVPLLGAPLSSGAS